jgi:hypothetical protein
MGRRVGDAVNLLLQGADAEFEPERFVVAGEVVVREGDHYRIENDDALIPDPSELPDPD